MSKNYSCALRHKNKGIYEWHINRKVTELIQFKSEVRGGSRNLLFSSFISQQYSLNGKLKRLNCKDKSSLSFPLPQCLMNLFGSCGESRRGGRAEPMPGTCSAPQLGPSSHPPVPGWGPLLHSSSSTSAPRLLPACGNSPQDPAQSPLGMLIFPLVSPMATLQRTLLV